MTRQTPADLTQVLHSHLISRKPSWVWMWVVSTPIVRGTTLLGGGEVRKPVFSVSNNLNRLRCASLPTDPGDSNWLELCSWISFQKHWVTWVAQLVKHPALDLHSGLDHRVVSSRPTLGSTLGGECIKKRKGIMWVRQFSFPSVPDFPLPPSPLPSAGPWYQVSLERRNARKRANLQPPLCQL